MTCRLFVTIDLDWASEVVIEETMNWFSQTRFRLLFLLRTSRKQLLNE